MLSHPAPGLVFGPHKGARIGRRAYGTPHRPGNPAGHESLKVLRSLAADQRDECRDLVEVFAAWDGLGFCELGDSLNERTVCALQLLPAEDLEEATEEWRSGDLASFMEGCELFESGTWRVIGVMPSEGQSLVTFFDGEYQDRPLAGRMLCIGLDGVLGFEEELAPSFGAFAQEFAADPAAWFEKVGFTWYVQSDAGMFGDPIEAYVADVRSHPDLRAWPSA